VLDVLAPVTTEGDVVPRNPHEEADEDASDPGACADFTHHYRGDGLLAVAADGGHGHRSPEDLRLIYYHDLDLLALRGFPDGILRLSVLRRRGVLLRRVLSRGRILRLRLGVLRSWRILLGLGVALGRWRILLWWGIALGRWRILLGLRVLRSRLGVLRLRRVLRGRVGASNLGGSRVGVRSCHYDQVLHRPLRSP